MIYMVYKHIYNACPIGTYGRYQARNGSSTCDLCGIGSYQDQLSSAECQNCTISLSLSLTHTHTHTYIHHAGHMRQVMNDIDVMMSFIYEREIYMCVYVFNS